MGACIMKHVVKNLEASSMNHEVSGINDACVNFSILKRESYGTQHEILKQTA